MPGVTGQFDITSWGLAEGVCGQLFSGCLVFRQACQPTNMVRRSLPCFLFLLRDLLRSAPLLRSYRIRLSGIYSASANRRLSEPERVPPLSMNAIKLSKPLIDESPGKYQLQTRILSFYFFEYKKGGGSRQNHISCKIIFQVYFFSTGYPAFFQACQPPLRAYTFG